MCFKKINCKNQLKKNYSRESFCNLKTYSKKGQQEKIVVFLCLLFVKCKTGYIKWSFNLLFASYIGMQHISAAVLSDVPELNFAAEPKF